MEICMGELFTPTHLIVIAVVVLVLFGGKKLPELGKGLGEGYKGFNQKSVSAILKAVDPRLH